MPTVGLLSIGQSPRPDLCAPLRAMRSDLTVVEAGALDHLSVDELPAASGAYPLTTLLRNGEQVTVDLTALEPLLQQALERLEQQSVCASMLLCAGTFASLQGNQLLFKPFTLVEGLLRAAGIQRIGVLCPFAGQEAAIRDRWLAAGYQVDTATAALEDRAYVDALLRQWMEMGSSIDAVVLDYVGHDPALIRDLQERHRVPVYDLGLTTMTVLSNTVPNHPLLPEEHE